MAVSADAPSKIPKSGGQITFISEERMPYRVEARPEAKLEPLAPAFDKLSKGKDRFINVAPDGSFLLIDTTRFGCEDWNCIALVKSDLSEGDAIRSGEDFVHSDGGAAVGPKGDVIVISDKAEKDHIRDLLVLRREGDTYSKPKALTAASPFRFNAQPSMSSDGKRVVFDCGTDPYAAAGTAVCEVGTDGKGFRVVIEPGKPGWAKKVKAFHHPSYSPDGSIVVEADKPPLGERIWRLVPGASEPVPVGDAFGNDNSPCVMPDGRVISLWLGRREGNGRHEIKVMSPDGKDHFMALVGFEVADVVLGCGAWK